MHDFGGSSVKMFLFARPTQLCKLNSDSEKEKIMSGEATDEMMKFIIKQIITFMPCHEKAAVSSLL